MNVQIVKLNQPKVRGGPDGLHLFDRHTGINILLDEMSVPQSHWAAAPRQVSIALTNACDLHCPYCYAPKHVAKLNMIKVISWLDELDRNGSIGVGFGGGEPTLYAELPKLCQYATQNTGMAVTITTHTHHLDESWVRGLKGNVHFLRVSMDGIGVTYEGLRDRSFQSFIHQLRYVREIAPFGINYVVNALTIPDIDNAVTFAVSVGAQELLLLPESSVDDMSGIGTDTLSALREWVHTYHGSLQLSISESDAAGFPVCTPFTKEVGILAYAHIDADGVIKRSSFDQEGILIGEKGILEAIAMLNRQSGDKS